jgi:hypothetical protein
MQRKNRMYKDFCCVWHSTWTVTARDIIFTKKGSMEEQTREERVLWAIRILNMPTHKKKTFSRTERQVITQLLQELSGVGGDYKLRTLEDSQLGVSCEEMVGDGGVHNVGICGSLSVGLCE